MSHYQCVMHLLKKNPYVSKGGTTVFTFWVIGTPAEIQAYKDAQSKRLQPDGSVRDVLVIDENDLFNGLPNPHKGSPVFFSPNRPYESETPLIFSANGNVVVDNSIELEAQANQYNTMMLQMQVNEDFANRKARRALRAASIPVVTRDEKQTAQEVKATVTEQKLGQPTIAK